jgi:hypothetical protein
MPAESRGEANNGYFMKKSRGLEFWIGVLDVWVEIRKKPAISTRKGV